MLFFYLNVQFFSAPFVEKTVFSPLNGLGTLVKTYLTISVKFPASLLFCSDALYTCLYANTKLFWLSFIVVGFEISNCETSGFVPYQDYFGNLRSLKISYEFSDGFFYICKKNVIEILIKNIKSFNPITWTVFYLSLTSFSVL